MPQNASSNAPTVLAEIVEPPPSVVVDMAQSTAIAPAQQRTHDRSRASQIAVLTVAIVILIAAAVLEVRGQTQVEIFGAALPELCLWRRFLGLSCPGCGMTRSFVSLAHGDLAGAWRFHIAGPALFTAVAFQIPYRGFKIWRLSCRQKRDGQA